MIISSNQINHFLKIYGQQMKVNAPGRKEAPAGTGKADELVLSEQGKAIQLAAQKVRETPDIREDRVRELKEAIEKGAYSVSSEEIAEKLLGRRLVDELV